MTDEWAGATALTAGKRFRSALLALCLGLLLALTFGVIAARQRFGAALVWVVTTPVVLAVAWLTTDVVMRLLPNLM